MIKFGVVGSMHYYEPFRNGSHERVSISAASTSPLGTTVFVIEFHWLISPMRQVKEHRGFTFYESVVVRKRKPLDNMIIQKPLKARKKLNKIRSPSDWYEGVDVINLTSLSAINPFNNPEIPI